MDVNARLLFSGFSTLCVAVLGGYFVRSHRARPNDSVLSQFCREPYKVRAEADAPWGALAAKPLRTRSVPASASPQSRRRALPPAKDVGILTMTPSVIANSRFRTILPTNHPCGCAEVPKNILSLKGRQSTLAQMFNGLLCILIANHHQGTAVKSSQRTRKLAGSEKCGKGVRG